MIHDDDSTASVKDRPAPAPPRTAPAAKAQEASQPPPERDSAPSAVLLNGRGQISRSAKVRSPVD